MIKHINVTAALAAAGLVVVGLSAGQAVAGISTTKHNLSSGSTATIKSADNTEICVFCHTPHDAVKNNNITLWNHALSTSSYTTYTSPTMDNAPGAMNAVTAATATTSNLCLSCHDGTVALNAQNNPSNATANGTMAGTGGTNLLPAGSTNLGTDLSNDHPVNMAYDRTLDTGLNDLAAVTTVKLYSNTVQCASCHDPHTSTNAPFLRASMTGSGLCLICHNK